MSTPFPLEQQAQVERPPAAWNPWQGPVRPSTWSMSINQNTDPIYMALEGLGQGAAKGEALLSGIWHTEYGLLAHVPGLRSIAGELERQTGAMQEDARERVKALTPDPTTTGAAAQTIHGLASGLYRVTVGALAGGPAGGAALVGSTEAASRYQELAEQGVTPGAAAAAAGVSGITSAAGALLPAGFGASLIGKVLTGGAGNVGFGLAARYADHKVLEAAGYPEMAAQQHVWDTTAVATDLLLGGGFGLLAHLHGAPPAATPEETRARIRELEARLGRNVPGAQDAALTVNLALRDRASAPGVPVDPAAAGAHQAALEKATEDLLQGKPVDVAGTGVENATFARRPPIERPAAQELLVNALREGGVLDEEQNLRELEDALGARLRGEKPAEPVQTPAQAAAGIAPKIGPISEAEIPRAAPGKLNDEDRAIETRFAQALAGEYEGMKARYAALPDAQGGKVLNVDTARELSPDYLADRTRSAAVHEPASWFIKRLYAEKLAEAPGPGEEPFVFFTGGGTGAGKSTGVRESLGNIADRAQIVYDSNLNSPESAQTKIDQALAAGKEVKIAYVFRGPIESLRHGALVRAMHQERDLGTGRTVPVEDHVDTHVGSNEAIREIAAHYEGDPRVETTVIDNSRAKGEVRVIPLAELPRLDYNFTREQALQTLQDELAAGRISNAVYRGFAGREPAAEHPAAGGLLDTGAGGPPSAHGESASLGAGVRGQPEPGRAEQRPDQLAPRPKVDPLAEPARQAIQENPNLEITDDEGRPVNAAHALATADQALSDAERDAQKGVTAAINCFARKGGD